VPLERMAGPPPIVRAGLRPQGHPAVRLAR
jgi:hypothetical protein